MKTTRKGAALALLLALGLLLTACSVPTAGPLDQLAEESNYTMGSIPAFSEDPYVVLNDNRPNFSESDQTTTVFEKYSELDSLGRCGVAYANVCKDTMPTERRGDISSVHPSGWVQAQYDFVDGKALYNRCHLLGYQLTAENDNERNLITGTRYMNTEGMLPFENMVADYVKETDNHVLYRVTPIYDGDNLVASGVEMEAYSVEDEGEGICYHVYCYNNQPGVEIDYATGESRKTDGTKTDRTKSESSTSSGGKAQTKGTKYVLNTSGKKFHLPSCSSVQQMKEENRKSFTGDRADLIAQGYEPCGKCKP